MIHFVVAAGGEWTLHEYFSHWGTRVADRFRILHYESLAGRTSFDRGTYVLADLHLTPGLQRLVEELYGRLSAADGVRFLNHPTRTMRRYALLEELRRRNLNDFRAVHLDEGVEALRYPIFLRSEWEHSGALSTLLHSPSEVERWIGQSIWQGRRWRDLLAVEFCDTADADGYYRKYSAYIVGDRILAKTLEYGRSWMLKHSQCEFSERMILEERAYIVENPHEAQLREIFRIAGVEYGRIDYSVRDGRVQTWEINLHPTIGRGPEGSQKRKVVPPELEPMRNVGKEHFYRAFAEAWEAVDLPLDGRPPIPIAFDARTVAAARSRPAPRGGFLRTLRQAARPLKPLLEPVSLPVFLFLARLARRGRR